MVDYWYSLSLISSNLNNLTPQLTLARMYLSPATHKENSSLNTLLANLFCLISLLCVCSVGCWGQINIYDEQSVFEIKAQLRSKGVRVEADNSCRADLFQLSKRILEGVGLDHLRFTSDERILSVEGIIDVKVVLFSRDWMRESMGVIIQSEIWMRDIPAMISFDSDGPIEFLPNKLEISKR